MYLNNEEILEILDLISEINANLADAHRLGDTMLEFATTGSYHRIVLNSGYSEIVLWNSQDDNRIYNEETDSYESFKDFLPIMLNRKIEILKDIKL